MLGLLYLFHRSVSQPEVSFICYSGNDSPQRHFHFVTVLFVVVIKKSFFLDKDLRYHSSLGTGEDGDPFMSLCFQSVSPDFKIQVTEV